MEALLRALDGKSFQALSTGWGRREQELGTVDGRVQGPTRKAHSGPGHQSGRAAVRSGPTVGNETLPSVSLAVCSALSCTTRPEACFLANEQEKKKKKFGLEDEKGKKTLVASPSGRDDGALSCSPFWASLSF